MLKLDFEKAYDKVDWKYLMKYCIKHKGFNEKWCIWIKDMVGGGTLRVKVNNVHGPYFGSHVGVRQGDPLSPFLFNVVVDCLNKMISKAQVAHLF